MQARLNKEDEGEECRRNGNPKPSEAAAHTSDEWRVASDGELLMPGRASRATRHASHVTFFPAIIFFYGPTPGRQSPELPQASRQAIPIRPRLIVLESSPDEIRLRRADRCPRPIEFDPRASSLRSLQNHDWPSDQFDGSP